MTKKNFLNHIVERWIQDFLSRCQKKGNLIHQQHTAFRAFVYEERRWTREREHHEDIDQREE
jgi:hypothetical protein